MNVFIIGILDRNTIHIPRTVQDQVYEQLFAFTLPPRDGRLLGSVDPVECTGIDVFHHLVVPPHAALVELPGRTEPEALGNFFYPVHLALVGNGCFERKWPSAPRVAERLIGHIRLHPLIAVNGFDPG
ncbi:hypothetical protein D3C86_1711730 [compost metagenome]